MISIVDYGLGNITAFLNVYKRLNLPARRVSCAAELSDAERVILPGVGSFDHAMRLLNASGMRETLERKVREERVPVIGICVGMQMLADSSEEGSEAGLGWVPGEVRSFRSFGVERLPMPHMGWNDITPKPGARLFAGMDEPPSFYFLHSYYYQCREAGDVLASAHYGADFACAVARENVIGVQFHPEKSHHCGYQLLKNFVEL